MEGIIFIVGIIFAFLLTVGVPILITIVLYKYLNRKSKYKWIKYLSFIPSLILIYMLYSAIFPSDDFYAEDYKEITQLEFPENAEIIYKDASYPDHFGDYSSIFVIRTTTETYKVLINQLNNLGYENKKDNFSYPKITEAFKKANGLIKYEYVYDKEPSKNYYVAFSSDNKTIILRRISW